MATTYPMMASRNRKENPMTRIYIQTDGDDAITDEGPAATAYRIDGQPIRPNDWTSADGLVAFTDLGVAEGIRRAQIVAYAMTHDEATTTAVSVELTPDEARQIATRLIEWANYDPNPPTRGPGGGYRSEVEPWTSHGCPDYCDRTYLGSGHAGGWSSDHDGRCPHGVYVGGSGADLMCGYCENGDYSERDEDGRLIQ